jgi:hypothetical protein
MECMIWNRAKALLFVAVILASVIGSYFLVSSSSSKPFDYSLEVSCINDTALQGQTLEANITVNYLQGTPQLVTLDAQGDSSIMQLQISNTTGTPKLNEPFTSNLTIHFLASAQPAKHPVNITSNSGSTVHLTTLNLTLANRQIQVTGTVATTSEDDIYPTKLQFTSQQTNATYNATLSFSRLPENKLQQQATYSVSLPNEQAYRVTGSWTRLPGPWLSQGDLPEGTFDCGILQVDCKSGESSLIKNFQS